MSEEQNKPLTSEEARLLKEKEAAAAKQAKETQAESRLEEAAGIPATNENVTAKDAAAEVINVLPDEIISKKEFDELIDYISKTITTTQAGSNINRMARCAAAQIEQKLQQKQAAA